MEQNRIENIENTEKFKYLKEFAQKNREAASKPIGLYLVKLSNICLTKCADFNNMIISKSESKCLESCFYKHKESYHHTYKKFHDITYDSKSLDRSELYDDTMDLMKSIFIKESFEVNSKNKENKQYSIIQ